MRNWPYIHTRSDGVDLVERKDAEAALAACAAGPWRYDVENAPNGEWVMTRDAGPFNEWRKGKRDGNVWTGADYNPIDAPLAFAVPNPPQVKP